MTVTVIMGARCGLGCCNLTSIVTVTVSMTMTMNMTMTMAVTATVTVGDWRDSGFGCWLGCCCNQL